MKNPHLIAKAVDSKTQSDSIVVSFATDWHKPLLEGRFKAVIRKRIPKKLKPKWLYFHINSPVAAICGRAEIASFSELTIAQAKAISSDLSLSVSEIDAYVGDGTVIGCYKLGRIELAKPPLTLTTLADHMIYHAPQSFFVISSAAKTIIDKLAGFHDRKLHQPK